MTKKTVLGMPRNVFYTICSILVIGIIIGSFYDYQISVALSNKTAIGDFYQHYGNIISHLLYPVAGMCLFKGLKKRKQLQHSGVGHAGILPVLDVLQFPRYKRR